jgi:ParB family chromosome partitioning protein
MAPDHGDRRRLAREAAAEGWTVRETEDRARALAQAGDPAPRPRRRPAPHPDQLEAAERLGDAFGRVLGAAVTVAPRGDGYHVNVAFASLDDALAAAERLGAIEHA